MKSFLQYLSEAKVSRPRIEPKSFSPEQLARLAKLGIINVREMVDTWNWNPDVLMYYINSLFNRRGCDIERTEDEITITFRRFEKTNDYAIYHLQEDGGAVYGWVENRYYGEDDSMDPYGGDEDSNSLCNKIARFMEWPEEYTKKFS